MADCRFQSRLNAFHDGELDEASARQFEMHLKSCATCPAELESLREVSRQFRQLPDTTISPARVSRIHAAVDEANEPANILRLAGLLSGLAASVLIVATAWMFESPTPARAPRLLVIGNPPAAEWEHVATTLEVRPLPQENWPAQRTPMLADARTADWMLRNLGE